jgi:hypothetical protein
MGELIMRAIGIACRNVAVRYMPAAVFLALLGSRPAALAGQRDANHEPTTFSAWTGDWSLAAANGLIAGLTAGVIQEARGGSFRDGFVRGAVGGLVIYSGKRIAGLDFFGDRLLARQVGAVGTALTNNAAAGRSSLERLFFPSGPISIELSGRGGVRQVSWAIDVYDVFRILQASADDRFRLDVGESLRSGALVFDACCGALLSRRIDGATDGSVIYLEEQQVRVRARILDHEMVHVIQRDFINRAWFNPLERKLGRAFLGSHMWPDWVRVSVLYPSVRSSLAAVGLFENGIGFLETEAEWVEWSGRE